MLAISADMVAMHGGACRLFGTRMHTEGAELQLPRKVPMRVEPKSYFGEHMGSLVGCMRGALSIERMGQLSKDWAQRSLAIQPGCIRELAMCVGVHFSTLSSQQMTAHGHGHLTSYRPRPLQPLLLMLLLMP
jgi:hypothetical protein